MLCKKCENIHLPHPQPPSKKRGRGKHLCLVKHHANLDELIAAAEAGCEICQFFRPFAEYGKLRRRGFAQRSASDCPPSLSMDWWDLDHFRSVGSGTFVSSGVEGIVARRTHSRVKYYVAPGKYYVDDSDSERYNYIEDEEVETVLSFADRQKAISRDDDRYEAEYIQRLAKLGLRMDETTENKTSGSAKASDNSQGYDLRYSQRMRSKLKKREAEIQWVLTTTDRPMDRDQLWMTLKYRSSYSSVNNSLVDQIPVLVLTAGSIDYDDLDEVASICLNGVHGYTRYSLGTFHPGIWRFRADYLAMPRKRPRRNIRPILEFYQRRDQTFPTDPRIQGREVLADPSSASVMALAKSWLERCIERDELCKLHGHVNMPSRLIDVGVEGSPFVKLHEVAANEEGIRYATLSHCWGSNLGEITRTLREDLAAKLEVMEVAKLSRNFRDAIHVTRGVGLRYLWIDALCIIQNSEDDWAAEAANMGDYYRGSELTILAMSASNAEQGFLGLRPAFDDPPCVKTESGTLYLRPLFPDTLDVMGGEETSDIRDRDVAQPANERAWTLQERLFSRRVLYFTENQMIWQCRSRFFGEDGQYAFNHKGITAVAGEDIIDILNYQQRIIEDSNERAPPTVRSTCWYALVKAFMQRRLTYDRDRLPAISGLAREVHRLTDERYVAGLWLKNSYYLKVGLLWSVCREMYDRTPRTPKRGDNTFPSWSWASIDAEIDHPAIDSGIISLPALDPTLIKVVAPLTSADPFGAVRFGRLILDAWHHSYQGLRSHEELFKDALMNERIPESADDAEKNLDSPKDDPLVTFDLDMPNDLWQVDGWWAHCCYSLMLVTQSDWFPDHKDNHKYSHAHQHFLLLKAERDRGLFLGWRRVGVGSTETGTRFQIDEHHGWERQRLYIH